MFFRFYLSILLAFSFCNDGTFSLVNDQYYIQLTSNSQVQNDITTERQNQATPRDLLVDIYRIELLSGKNDSSPIFFSFPNKDEIPQIIKEFDGYATVLSGRLNSTVEKNVKYLRVYFGAIGIKINVAGFLEDTTKSSDHSFFTFFNDVVYNGYQFSAGEQGAIHPTIKEIQWLDPTLEPRNGLSNDPVAKSIQSIKSDGQSSKGYYYDVSVESYLIEQGNGFILRIRFFSRDIFSWDDVLSDVGTFDARSQDLFNWEITVPGMEAEIEDI